MCPFLFRLLNGAGDQGLDKWMVKIAHFDYTFYSSRWMDDKILGETCLVPDVDITSDEKLFDSEEAALAFIKKWWAEQKV
jgi:hypothetical protein